MIRKKPKNEWAKPANIIALASVIALVIVFIAETSVTINANNRLDKAYDESTKLQEELNSLLNSTLAQSNNLTQQALQLQNVTSNFQPVFIPYSITASVRDVYTNATLDRSGLLEDYGGLGVSLVVISPHASIINFTDTAFNVTVRAPSGNDDFLNSTNFVGSDAFIDPYLPYGFFGNQYSFYWPEAFVQAGVTQVNFTIPIFAELALNSNFTGAVFGGSLGTVNAEVTMFDVQTGKYVASYYLSTNLFVNVNWIYG